MSSHKFRLWVWFKTLSMVHNLIIIYPSNWILLCGVKNLQGSCVYCEAWIWLPWGALGSIICNCHCHIVIHLLHTFPLYMCRSNYCPAAKWTIMSWQHGDLQLWFRNGHCSRVDSWAVLPKQWPYPIPSFSTHWNECGLQWCCNCTMWWYQLCGQSHKYCQPHYSRNSNSVWYELYPDNFCCT